MKLPSIIAESGGSSARARQVNPDDLRPGGGRTGFDDILSGLHGKAAGPADHAKPTRGTTTPVAPARNAQDKLGAPRLDALTARAPSTAEAQARPRARDASGASAREDDGVDGLLKRVSGGDETTTESSTSAAPQDPILALVAPGTGSQMSPSSMSSASEPASRVEVPLDAPNTTAIPMAQPASTAAKPPLVSDISVASQLAPTPTARAGVSRDVSATDASRVADTSKGGQTAGPDRSAAPMPLSHVEAALDAAGETIVPHAGKPGHAPVEKGTPSSGDPARPSSGATSASVAITAAAPSDPRMRSDDRAPSSQLERSTHPGLETDAGTTRADDTTSSPRVTNPATTEMPATALSTLSPPVRQVAVALTRLAADTSAPSNATPVPDPSTPRPIVARTLTLQMSPAAMGTVAVRMHATGGTLDLQLTASDPHTAGLLVRERDALAASLQDGKTTLHSLVILDGSGGPRPGGHDATQGDRSGTEAQADRHGGDPGFDGDGRQRRERPESQARGNDGSDGDLRRGPRVQRGGADRSLLV